jgi:thymidylate synthase ThyX
MKRSEADRELRDRLAASTLKAGHLTTRQHVQFVFVLDRVSRHFVWSFLHSHPFYNSEQVSQRYVEVKPGNFYIPERMRADVHQNESEKSVSESVKNIAEIYKETLDLSMSLYKELSAMLFEPAEKEYYKIFPNRARHPDKWKSSIHKKAIETARYVLPVATHTYLYHTVNGLTLHRYVRMMNDPDVTEEARFVISQMVEEVKKIDPDYAAEFMSPLPAEEFTELRILKKLNGLNTEIMNQARAEKFTEEFDHAFDESGLSYSVLENCPQNLTGFISQSFHAVLGLPSETLTEQAVMDALLDPSENNHISSPVNESIHSRTTRVLQNFVLLFRKKISHTADSQDQRHRLTPASRPLLMTHYTGKPDYITPVLISENPAILEKYKSGMEIIFNKINQFLQGGGSAGEAVYLLPNAFPIRFFESGDLLALRHKWALRLCYNAQEEIFQASLDEVRQIENAAPSLKGYFRAPCYMRHQAGINPPCPEGNRFCGVRVWEMDLKDYKRIL